jgi:hypothetical protein
VDKQEIVEQSALPLEILHSTHWIHPLLQSSHFHSNNHRLSREVELRLTGSAPIRHADGGLRTVIAVRPEQIQAADQLVRRRYAWRGYRVAFLEDFEAGTPGSEGYPVTLLAEDREKLLGTLTVRPDSPQGLLAEESYGPEIERLRRDGRRIGELVKLAVEEGVDWKAALDALVQSAYLVTHVIHALTDVLIEVNPRHVRFYQRVFGFVVAAGERMCARAGAPSVLMQLDIAQFGRRLELSAAA